jgi:hypothetical protein
MRIRPSAILAAPRPVAGVWFYCVKLLDHLVDSFPCSMLDIGRPFSKAWDAQGVRRRILFWFFFATVASIAAGELHLNNSDENHSYLTVRDRVHR